MWRSPSFRLGLLYALSHSSTTHNTQAEGVLTQNLFDDRYKDQTFTSFTLFQDIVRLNDTYCKMLLEMVQFNLWRAWLLFVEKRANLDDSHFLPPMN